MARIPHISSNMAQKQITISELLGLVQRDYLDNKRKSFYNLNKQIEKYLEPHFGKLAAEQLTMKQVEEYKSLRLDNRAARATINLELSTLRRAGKLGQERGLIASFCIVKLYPIGNSNRRVGFFEDDEYQKQLDACYPKHAELASVLVFGYETGWRLGEILSLRWSTNYDEQGQCIRIFDSKSGKGRVFPLDVCPELHDLIEALKHGRLGGSDWMFTNRGCAYDPATFNRHWHTVCATSGVERHFHDLRRTVVRRLMRRGVHRAIAKTITGHESDTVFDRYDIVNENDIRDALRQVAKFNGHNGNDSIKGNANIPPPVEHRASSTLETPSNSPLRNAIGDNYAESETIRHFTVDGPTSRELHAKEMASLKEETTELGKYSRLLDRLMGFMSRSRR